MMFLIFTNDNKYRIWKSQKAPELAVPCFDFYGTPRDEKYNMLDKKRHWLGLKPHQIL